MRQSIRLAAMASVWLLAGCAAAPEPVADTSSAGAITANESLAAVAGAESAKELGVLVVDVNRLPVDDPVICHDMLRPGSNVQTTVCITQSQWKEYKRAEAERAEATVRMWQGTGPRL